MTANIEGSISPQVTAVDRADRRNIDHVELVTSYYDAVTRFYEVFWGDSFHFAPRRHGESWRHSLIRDEYWMAAKAGIRRGMNVLDVGCGIGGPMRNIARFTDACITGVTISQTQVTRGERKNKAAGLSHSCRIRDDYMCLSFADNTFDAAYDIEATAHAPDLRDAYAEVLRVLRPGALFGGYEWCMTDQYDPLDAEHLRMKQDIEQGTAIGELRTRSAVDTALAAAGFEILETEDRAEHSDPGMTWYRPLASLDRGLLAAFFLTRPGRVLLHRAVFLAERCGAVPVGTGKVHEAMLQARDALVRGGELGIFTPHYFVLGRKPGNGSVRPSA